MKLKGEQHDNLVAKALLMLRATNFNFTRTAREIGVNRQTIRQWANKAGVVRDRNNLITLVNDNQTVIDHKLALSHKVTRLKMDIITQMGIVLPKCKSLETLARVLQIVHEVDVTNDGKGEIPSIVQNTQNFIQLINSKLEKNAENS